MSDHLGEQIVITNKNRMHRIIQRVGGSRAVCICGLNLRKLFKINKFITITTIDDRRWRGTYSITCFYLIVYYMSVHLATISMYKEFNLETIHHQLNNHHQTPIILFLPDATILRTFVCV